MVLNECANAMKKLFGSPYRRKVRAANSGSAKKIHVVSSSGMLGRHTNATLRILEQLRCDRLTLVHVYYCRGQSHVTLSP